MSPELVAIVAAMYAVIARLEGMQVSNALALQRGPGPAYFEADFLAAADELDRLSTNARSCQS